MLAKGGLAALLLACIGPVHAETLKEALTAAYLYNPTLKAAQAQLRSTDNTVSLAKSGYRPTISGTYQFGFEDLRETTRSVSTAPGSFPVCPGAINSNGTCAGGGAQSVPLSNGAGGTSGFALTPV
jgi:outer membrane protein